MDGRAERIVASLERRELIFAWAVRPPSLACHGKPDHAAVESMDAKVELAETSKDYSEGKAC
jgi:hypothetical protein